MLLLSMKMRTQWGQVLLGHLKPSYVPTHDKAGLNILAKLKTDARNPCHEEALAEQAQSSWQRLFQAQHRHELGGASVLGESSSLL